VLRSVTATYCFGLGYVLARLLKQDPNHSRTIALETGIQNGPLAVLIVTPDLHRHHAARSAADPGAVLSCSSWSPPAS
ncbi:MAG: hypothetical protein U5L74_15180, partial [Ideonella sp.]|nr:hypothetical protein [Ideonella sp.]